MNKKGLTLIELLIALVISSILVAAIYRTFVSQQHAYVVQDQVVDMQQNVRAAVNQMVREIRMAGFGNVPMLLPITIGSNTFTSAITLDKPVTGAITVVAAIGGTTELLTGPGETTAAPSSTLLTSKQIQVSSLVDSQGDTLFDTGLRKYISIDGLESNIIYSIEPGNKIITLLNDINYRYVSKQSKATLQSLATAKTASVYPIRAISYSVEGGSLKRNTNVGGVDQPLADNIEGLVFQIPSEQMVQISLTAKTKDADPELKGGDGYRKRALTTNIQLRNAIK